MSEPPTPAPPDELAQMLATHERAVRRFLTRHILAEPQTRLEVDDLWQDVCTKALEHRQQWESEARQSDEAWLLTVAHNVLVDAVRKAKSQKRGGRAPRRPTFDKRTVEQLAALVVNRGPSPAEAASAREVKRRVHTALRQLPAQYQHVLALRYGRGLNAEQIAVKMGEEPRTVKTWLGNARRLFRRRYGSR